MTENEVEQFEKTWLKYWKAEDAKSKTFFNYGISINKD